MSSDGVNTGRRKFLTAATSAVGVAGAVGVAVPLSGFLEPVCQGQGGRCASEGRHRQAGARADGGD